MATYISVNDVVYSEQDGAAVFTLTLDAAAPAGGVTVAYSTANGTASSSGDFSSTSGSVTIAEGATTGTITVTLANDASVEFVKGFLLNLSTATADAYLVRNQTTALIVDNDATSGTPNVSASDVVVDESAGTATVVVTLDRPATGSVSVRYATQAATAVEGEDYIAASGTLVFAAGETSKTVTIGIVNDTVTEGRELFALALTSASGATISDPRAHVVIQANDATAVTTPTLNVQGGTIVETQGYVDFLVTLSAPATGAVSVDYATSNGTASAGTDYITAGGTLVFAPGQTSQVVRVLTADNDVADGNRSFSLVLSGANGGTLGVSSATGTIIDDNATTLPSNASPVVITATSAGDILGGTAYADSLVGGAGNDLLDGRAAGDTMVGGNGDDIYIAEEEGGGVAEYSASGGHDTVISYNSSFSLSGIYVEDIVLGGTANISATGNTLDNYMKGNTGNNALSGGAGNDTLDGGAGNDTMTGGTGDDVFYVDSVGDVVNENTDEGSDTVHSSITYTLGTNLEHLVLTGTADLNGTGNASGNQLTGNAGANTLDGGAGIDTMAGGAGDDTYYVDSSSDVVSESAGEGVDTVYASASFVLGANVENLVLSGASAINGTGNDGANAISGNDAANWLSGGDGDDTLVGGDGADSLVGGAGADSMSGGLGNDVYYVDSASDIVTEAVGQGTDTVYSSVDQVLGSNLENLNLMGSGAINGTGNDLANMLIGNSGANVLTGGAGNDSISGGAGADTMIGGTGNDVYFVDNAGDVVTEASGEGTDLVQTMVSYTLGANAEYLTLNGSAAINGTGNELNNLITGNAAANVLTGGGGNDTLKGGAGVDTLVGGTGNDLYIVDEAIDTITELSGEGTDTVQSSVTLTLSANVENLTLTGSGAVDGTGNDLANVLTGNGAANTLSGGAGNDTLTGGAGNDTLAGGTGDDTYVVDATGDVVTELSGEGTDQVQASATYTLSANVEHLTLTGSGAINGTGNDLANMLIGNSGANVLTGGAGNDSISGGAGADTMIGGTGNDVYFVDNAGDVVTEASGEGTDLVQTMVSYTLGANAEYLTLNGSAAINGTGNELNNLITGNAAANVLTGGGGNDTLKGGAGVDTLVGGTGNDLYIVDEAIDTITELSGEGTDTVQSSVTLTLSANVENLTLTGSGAVDGTGNDLANVLTGNGAANTLSGGAGNDTLTGGAGNDTLVGGTGDDTYVVDATGDVVTELSGEGTDQVQASATYTLSANVEHLTLTGSGAINGTGNDLANMLIGNSGANVLTGGAGNDSISGGAGADTMIGGTGNDVYFVDNAGDVVTEASGEGTDLVQTMVSYTLGANAEYLTLNGSAAINGTGNELNNLITGNAAANVLTGGGGNDTLKGGAGMDTLMGGQGADVFVFDTALNAGTNVDVISDFTAGDLIRLDNDIFDVGSPGALNASAFFSGAGLTGSTSPSQGAGIYYDTVTGHLYYDHDGSGGDASVQFATVTGAPSLTAGSFGVVD